MTVTLLRGDALHLPIADHTVDLVVTSPPYFGLRSYQDGGQHYAGQIGSEATPAEWVDAMLAATAEMVRCLKPCGSIWVNLGDKYAGRTGGPQGASGARATRSQAATYEDLRPLASSGFQAAPHLRQSTNPSKSGSVRRDDSQSGHSMGQTIRDKSLIGLPWRYALACIDQLGLILRAEVIWSKPNGLPESVTDRVRRSHEQWFHFTVQPRYFSAVDEIREAHAGEFLSSGVRNPRYGRPGGMMPGVAAGIHPGKKQTAGENDGRAWSSADNGNNPLGKLPGSVWSIPSQPLTVPPELGVDHFAAFPMEWPRRLIGGWSPSGGCVADPFGGTGTTALVAHVMGRHGITVDLSADYCDLAAWRTTDPGQLAQAAQVEKPPAQTVGQATLFEGAS